MRWHQDIFRGCGAFFLLDDGIMQRLQPGVAQPRTNLVLHFLRELSMRRNVQGF